MKKQAVNTFQKGLQLDTHPMAQSNDTLSDALNATFVTMNGNEIILQNDMGNRRIDNAYLPSGYEPVGIKEYGGVIYLALYNPITNKSQIGSFPSPERKIDDLDDSKLKGTLNFLDSDNSSFTKTSIDGVSGCYWVGDKVLIPLSSKNSLHAGDKFVIYGQWDEEYKKNLSNLDNLNYFKSGIRFYKNKQYTLSVGILNSQNEFVDITKSLKRWKVPEGNNLPNWNTTNNQIKIENNNSETLKSLVLENLENEELNFNNGYFINFNISSNNTLADSINDDNLKTERQLLPVNTYAYKLVGPMYLQAVLNHPQTFQYNLYGKKQSYEDINRITLQIEADIDYNCPDGYIPEDGMIQEELYGGYKLDLYNVNSDISNSNPALTALFQRDTQYQNSHFIKGTIQGGQEIFIYKIPRNDGTYGVFSNASQPNPNYKTPSITLGECPIEYNSTITTNFFDFAHYNYTGGNSQSRYIIEPQENPPLEYEITYNKIQNLFHAHVVHQFTFDIPEDVHILPYKILVKATSSNNDRYYIKDLSIEGELNVDLLGTGELELKRWKFYNDVEAKQSIIDFDINTYLMYGQKLKGIKFGLWDNSYTPKTIHGQTYGVDEEHSWPEVPDVEISTKDEIHTGSNRLVIDWNDYPQLKSRRLYVIKAKTVLEEKNNPIIGTEWKNINLSEQGKINWPFLLTTELFNTKYEDLSIEDFRTLNKQIQITPTVSLDIESFSENNFSRYVKRKKENNQWGDGNILSSKSLIYDSSISQKSEIIDDKFKQVNFIVKPKAGYNDSELYPKYISLQENISLGNSLRIKLEDNYSSIRQEFDPNLEGYESYYPIKINGREAAPNQAQGDLHIGKIIHNGDIIIRDEDVQNVLDREIETEGDLDELTFEHSGNNYSIGNNEINYSSIYKVQFEIEYLDKLFFDSTEQISVSYFLIPLSSYINNNLINNASPVVDFKIGEHDRRLNFVRDIKIKNTNHLPENNSMASDDDIDVYTIHKNTGDSFILKLDYSTFSSEIQNNFKQLNLNTIFSSLFSVNHYQSIEDDPEDDTRYMLLQQQPANARHEHPDDTDGFRNSDKSRIWWKTENDTWALIDGAFRNCKWNGQFIINEADKYPEQIINLFPDNIYIGKEPGQGDNTTLYYPQNAIFSDYYKTTYTLHIIPIIAISAFTVNDNGIKFPIEFIPVQPENPGDTELEFIGKYIDIPIESSSELQENYNKLMEVSNLQQFMICPDYDNIYLDNEGNNLNPRNLYKWKNGHFEYWNNKYVGINEQHQLICRPNKTGIVNYPIDFGGGTGRDTWITLKYDTVESIDKDLLMYGA